MSFDVNKYKYSHSHPKDEYNTVAMTTVISLDLFIYAISMAYNQYSIVIVLILIHILLIPFLNNIISKRKRQIDNLFEEKYREFERKLKEHVQSRR